MVAQSPDVVNTVPGRMLTDPDWLTARIAEMGRSWGTGAARVGGTLWWCMVASALVEPVARAYAAGERAPLARLDRIGCDVRPDGGVDHIVFIGSSEADDEAMVVDQDRSAPARSAAGTALHDTLAAVIAQVAAVSGARPPALWAVVADAIGNRAIDAGVPEAGTRVAAEIGGKLPAPRFVEIGHRTFVRRISCCLVYEVPGCEMCTSCPKRPSAERERLLARMASQD